MAPNRAHSSVEQRCACARVGFRKQSMIEVYPAIRRYDVRHDRHQRIDRALILWVSMGQSGFEMPVLFAVHP